MEPAFSNGLHLANLTVSSGILIDSWNAVSKPHRDDPLAIIEEHPDYNIIAFVSSPVTTTCLREESCLVPISEIPDFQFLRSDTFPSFSIDKAAFSRFNSLRGKFPQPQEEVKTSSEPKASIPSAEKNKKEKPIPYIITGHGLNGSVASLFTLSLLNTLDPTKFKLLCITYGSPLLGDAAFQQAVLRHPTWNSSFLHVVHKGDSVPRSYLVPTPAGPSPYKPFGTVLLCSESGGACFQAPESVIELLKYENPEAVAENQESRTIDYGKVIECIEKMHLRRNVSSFLGYEADSYEAGTAVGLWQLQQQNEGIYALIKDIAAHEKSVAKQQREELHPAELEEMKVYMTFLEWYINKCRGNGQGPGYYDSFKNAQERHGNGVDMYKTYLTVYWEKVVEDAEKKPQLPGAPLRTRWLYAGNNYRRIVEPLDIAEYYRRGRKDYLTRGRSKHYERLEKWLEDHQESEKARKKGKEKPEKSEKTRKEGKETQDGPCRSKVVNVMEDSCFWARVEDAIRSYRTLDRDKGGSSDDSKFEEYVMDLIDREKVSADIFLEKSSYMDRDKGGSSDDSKSEYVMDLITRKKVSADKFLEKSSYMQWWRENREMLSKKVKEVSHPQRSALYNYMMYGRYKDYGKGPSTSADPRG